MQSFFTVADYDMRYTHTHIQQEFTYIFELRGRRVEGEKGKKLLLA